MAKYIIILDDDGQGVTITGHAVLTSAELAAGEKRTAAIALGQLACHFVSEWTDDMVEKYDAHVKAASAAEDAIKRVPTPPHPLGASR